MPSQVIEMNETLEAVTALAPVLGARADEIERGRRLPPDLVEELTAAGCFLMLVPHSHGGAELDLPADMRVIEELARADGSVGWTAMIGHSAPVLLGKLPRQAFDAIYADGPDVILGGTLNPTGGATPVDGGFRVTGQWSFASGCQHSHWFIAHCMVDDGRQPPMRMMVLPAADVEIKDTWSVSGLCGTGTGPARPLPGRHLRRVRLRRHRTLATHSNLRGRARPAGGRHDRAPDRLRAASMKTPLGSTPVAMPVKLTRWTSARNTTPVPQPISRTLASEASAIRSR
jgi:hypothetical protein